MSNGATPTIGLATGDDDTITGCARLWAEAAAHRDGRECTEPDVRCALGGLRGRLRMRGADLLVALDGADAGELVGFVSLVPLDGELEVFHLATATTAWGRGVGSQLLAAAAAMARAGRLGSLRLWVLDDNERAAAVYERAGWQPTDETQTTDAGRVERRWRRTL